MVTSNPDIDGPAMQKARAIREKYKDFKFLHEIKDNHQESCISELFKAKSEARIETTRSS